MFIDNICIKVSIPLPHVRGGREGRVRENAYERNGGVEWCTDAGRHGDVNPCVAGKEW